MDRLSFLVQRRATIEAKMFTSSQNIENAFIYADKAIEFAFGRRLQSIAKQQKVVTESLFLSVLKLMENFRHRWDDGFLIAYEDLLLLPLPPLLL